jgi:hypothetical protein
MTSALSTTDTIREGREGSVEAGGIAKRVFFEDAYPALNDQIDAACCAKHCRYPASYVDHIAAPDARSTTIRWVPR